MVYYLNFNNGQPRMNETEMTASGAILIKRQRTVGDKTITDIYRCVSTQGGQWRITKGAVEIGEADSLVEVDHIIDAYKARVTDAARKIADEANKRARKNAAKLAAQIHRLAH